MTVLFFVSFSVSKRYGLLKNPNLDNDRIVSVSFSVSKRYGQLKNPNLDNDRIVIRIVLRIVLITSKLNEKLELIGPARGCDLSGRWPGNHEPQGRSAHSCVRAKRRRSGTTPCRATKIGDSG
jgi:hypothetical protein